MPAFDIKWFEIYNESRSSTVDRSNITKDFGFYVCGEFVENAETDILLDPLIETPMILDDILVQRAVYETFAPFTYIYQFDDDRQFTLYLASTAITQIAVDIWKVILQYDIPQDNGQNQGGGGGGTGPSEGETNSDEFTQLSFDFTPTTKTVKWGLCISHGAKVGLNNPYGNVYPMRIPLGVSDTEIEGVEEPERAFRFSITQYRPPTRMKYAYIRKLTRLSTCVNDATFFGFAKGSIRFFGGSAQGDLFKNVPLTLNFEHKGNFKLSKTGPTVYADPEDDDVENMFDTLHDPDFGDSPGFDTGVPGMAFAGWCGIIYEYVQDQGADSKSIKQRPIHRFITRLFEYADFTKFEL